MRGIVLGGISFAGSGKFFLALNGLNGAALAGISVPSGIVTFENAFIRQIAFQGGATFIANNSYDLGNNTGITINEAQPYPRGRIGLGM